MNQYPIKTYPDFIEMIKEGLIMTHDINTSVGLMERELFTLSDFKYTIEKNSNKTFTIMFENKHEIYEVIITLANTLGYFCSRMMLYFVDEKQTLKFDLDVIKNNITNIKEFELTFESKFDDEIKFKPEYLYHLCEKDNLEKILKIGLVNKANQRIGNHPERIYLTYDLDKIDILYKRFTQNDLFNKRNNEYYCLKIKNNNLKLYNDPNFYDQGCYTYDNISPKNILDVIKLN